MSTDADPIRARLIRGSALLLFFASMAATSAYFAADGGGVRSAVVVGVTSLVIGQVVLQTLVRLQRKSNR